MLAVGCLIAAGGGRAVAADRPSPAAVTVTAPTTPAPAAPLPTEPTTTVPVTTIPATTIPATTRPPVTTVPRPRPVTTSTPRPTARVAAASVAVAAPSDCGSALAAVQASGLVLPAGVPFVCPKSIVDSLAGLVLGATLRAGSVQGQVLGVEIDLAQIVAFGRPGLLGHVIAHELCHVAGIESESGADACAASHGFPMV
ncbi:MAG: hypothetical protein ACRD0Q_06540 [Acidimicrobiales bacterium]